MTNTPDKLSVQQFILHALHIDQPNLMESAARLSAADWDETVRLANAHRLGPILHKRLSQSDIREALPDTVRQVFKVKYQRNSIRNLALYRELIRLTELLNAHGIPSLALKGAYLARFAYPEPNIRWLRDLDLLVPEAQVQVAFDLLVSQGYRQATGGHAHTHGETSKHLPMLIGPEGLAVELHLRLLSPHNADLVPVVPSHFAWDRLWSRRIERRVGETAVQFLCPTDLLLHLCLHATVEHHFNVGPLALADIVYLLQDEAFDWEDFLSMAESGAWQAGVLPALDMARRLLGAAVPDEAVQRLANGRDLRPWQASADYLLFSELADIHSVGGLRMAAVLFADGGIRHRLSLTWQGLFVSRQQIAREFTVDPASLRVFFYYPLRWWRLGKTTWQNLRQADARQTAVLPLVAHKARLDAWLQQGRQTAGRHDPAERRPQD
ncbi:MAG: nucleotidyltransferase family protein [Burkholderiaceae bacterium]